MTISSTVRIAGPFTGNGVTTTFPFTYKVFSTADVQVIRLTISTGIETTLTIVTDYTITLNGDQDSNPGGNIVLVTQLLALYKLTATSDIANLQPTDLTNQGGFFPEVITDALDRATIQIQQLADQTDRAIKIPISDGVLDMTTPGTADRASKYFVYDASGKPSVSSGSGTDTALRTDLANASASLAGSRLSGFRQTGTGATARTVDAKLKDTVSVKDFGAVGDGVTDDTAAIQAALNSGFNRVYVPKGVYRFISQLVIPSNTILFGDGDSSVFDWGGSTNAGKLVVVGSTTNVTLQSFKVDCNSADGTISLGNKDIGIVVDTSGSQITIQNITIYDAARHALVVQSGNIIRLENINITLGCVSSALLVGSFPASYGFVVNQSTVDVFLSNILVDYVKSDAIGFWNCGGGDGYSTLCKNIVCNNIIVKRWGRGLGVSYAFWNSGITTEVTDMALSNFVFDNQNVGNNQGRGLHQESGSRLSFSNGSIVNLITTTPDNTNGYALSIQGGTGLNFSNIHIENTGIGVVASSSSADRVYLNQISVKNSTYAGVYLLYPKQFVFDGCFFEHDRSIGTQENAFYCLLNDAFNVTNLTIQNTHLHLKNGTLGAPYALHIGSLTPTSFAGCQISLFNLHSPNTNLLNNGSYFPDIYVGESVSVKILETVAAATDYEVPIMQSGQKTCVLSCRSSFSTGIPSDATNFNTYDLYKRNSAGGGATLMTIGNTTFAAQDWVTAFETCSFRIVDTISQSHLANNESLTWRKTHGGLGQAETNGTVTVQYVTF